MVSKVGAIFVSPSGFFFGIVIHRFLGGGFKHFFIFTPTWGNDPI